MLNIETHLKILLALFIFPASFISIQAADDSNENNSSTLRIPACTAYCDPDVNGVKISAKEGVTGWSDSKQKISWWGKIEKTGALEIALSLRVPKDQKVKLRLTCAEKSFDAEVQGKEDDQTVKFGSVEISKPGYVQFQLEGIEKSGAEFGTLAELVLKGAAAKDAFFNQKPRRNAASVHLGYPTPKEDKIEWFYNEVTVRIDPVWSYFMACGFARGYFGIQVNSPTERRVIFSVWDSGKEPTSRDKVAADDRTQLVKKGEGVVAGDFGNEGTGGHSHLVYTWAKDTTYKFLVHVHPEDNITTYSGYFYFPEKKAWGLIATFKAPKDGSYLRGLYSFSEDFVGSNGHLRRLSEFGNQWVKTADGDWRELTEAKFSHDKTGYNDRHDYGAGVTKEGRFYLSNGGFTGDPIKLGDKFTRPETKQKPDVDLKALEELAK